MGKIRALPMLFASLTWAAGILLSSWVVLPLWAWLLPLPVCGVAIALGKSHFILKKLRLPVSVFIAIAILCMGGVAGQLRGRLPANHISNLEGAKVRLTGIVEGNVTINDKGTRFDLQTKSVSWGGDLQSVSGIVRVYLKPGECIPASDALVAVNAKIEPMKTRNAGYARYLKAKGLTHVAWVSPGSIEEIGNPGGLMHSLNRLRASIISRIDGLMPDSRTAGFAVAMLLGDKSGLDYETTLNFQASGLSHILAISGMNVCLVLVVIEGFLRLFTRNVRTRRFGEITAILLLVLYAILSGASPAVVRAVLMTGTIILSRLIQLRTNYMNVLGAAAFVQLIYDPWLLFDPGFQLSYLALAGILLWSLPIQLWMEKQISFLPSSLASSMAMTLAAQAATVPIIVLQFQQFPTWFLVANVLALPLATWAVRLGFIGMLVCFIPGISYLIFQALDVLLWLILKVSEWVSALPGAIMRSPTLDDPGFVVLLIMAGIVVTFLLGRKFLNQGRQRAPTME